MNPKYSEILNIKTRDCFEWTAMAANKIFNLNIPIREREEVYSKHLTEEKVTELVLKDLSDFGFDIVDDEPKPNDLISFGVKKMIAVAVVLDDGMVGFCGKLYPLKRMDIKKVFRKTREGVKECRPLNEVLDV